MKWNRFNWNDESTWPPTHNQVLLWLGDNNRSDCCTGSSLGKSIHIDGIGYYTKQSYDFPITHWAEITPPEELACPSSS